MTDIGKNLEQTQTNYSVTVCGKSFEIGDLIEHKSVPGGKVSLEIIPSGGTKNKQLLGVQDLEQVVIGFETQDVGPAKPFLSPLNPNVPSVGIAISKIYHNINGVQIHLTQQNPQANGDRLWQEYDIDIDSQGRIIDGYGSAETFNEHTSLDLKEAPFTDITDQYDQTGQRFLKVNFGNGAMGGLLHLLGLPSEYVANGRVIDSQGRNLLSFENLVKQLLELPSAHPDAKLLLATKVLPQNSI